MYIGLKPFMKAFGWDVVTVEEVGIRGTDDLSVVEKAKSTSLTIVTQDSKVAELARIKGVGCVVVGQVEIAEVIDQKLREFAK